MISTLKTAGPLPDDDGDGKKFRKQYEKINKLSVLDRVHPSQKASEATTLEQTLCLEIDVI